MTASGFHADLERMHRKGWRIEVLSWTYSCNRRMKEWAEQKGKFYRLGRFLRKALLFWSRHAPDRRWLSRGMKRR